jgi:hypothetical protein
MSTIEHGLNVCSRHNFDNSKSKQNNSENFGVCIRQGCQMVYIFAFQNLGTFWSAFEWKMWCVLGHFENVTYR